MSDTPKDFLDEIKKDANEKQQTFESILEDLNTNEKYQAYFNQYNKKSVESFKEHYARYKTDSLAYKEFLKERELKEAMAFSDLAIECLWDIQYFKLLQLQCRWRANEIVLPGVKTIYDFFYWQLFIDECTFIEPISEADVEIYITYLQQEKSNKVFEFSDRHQMYRYESNKADMNNKEKLHPYYWYMFNLLGRTMFELPDIEGERIKRYYDAVNEYNNIHNPPPPPDPNADKRPIIYSHIDKDMNTFLEHIGETKLKDFRTLKREVENMFGGLRHFDGALELLKSAGDNWPIEYHDDWRFALIDAGIQYKKAMVIKAIPHVYKDYLFMQQSGITFTAPDVNEFLKGRFIDNFMKSEKESLKQGMELLGEQGAIDLE